MSRARLRGGIALLAGVAVAVAAAPAQADSGPGPVRPAAVTPRPAALTAAAAAPVTAGTIVYIKDANVWIARPDGTGARRLTTDGTTTSPYRSPSEDDAGHVVALRGNRLSRLDQWGHVLQAFTVPAPGLATDFASVSPDGSKVAYSSEYAYTDCSFTPCHTLFEHMLGYTSATRSATVSGTRPQSDSMWASWAGNSRVIVGTHTDPSAVRYHDLTAAGSGSWFTDCDETSNPCSSDPSATDYDTFPAVSRAGDRYAAVVMVVNGQDSVATYLTFQHTAQAATAAPPPVPTLDCYLTGSATTGPWPGQWDASIQTPSWSPDGRALVAAFRNSAGAWQIWRVDVGDNLASCGDYGGGPVIDGGTQPRWSPAPLQQATSTRLSVSPQPAVRGRTVTLTATVRPAAGGAVQFRDGSRTLATVTVSAGRAVYRSARLAAGPHTLRAIYRGSAGYRASTSRAVTLVVQPTRPPRGWRFHSTRVSAFRPVTLAARRAHDVRVRGVARVPRSARGVLLRLQLSRATRRTAVALCPRPARGAGIPRGCWSLAVGPHQVRTGYVIVRIGAASAVRLWDRAGRVRAGLAVLGYYT